MKTEEDATGQIDSLERLIEQWDAGEQRLRRLLGLRLKSRISADFGWTHGPHRVTGLLLLGRRGEYAGAWGLFSRRICDGCLGRIQVASYDRVLDGLHAFCNRLKS